MLVGVEVNSSRKEMGKYLEASADRPRERVMRKFKDFGEQQGCLSLQ